MQNNFIKFMRIIFSMIVMSFMVGSSYAADMSSPVGEWITVSDKTHDRSGIVNIYEKNGKLYGKIIKIYPVNGRDPAELCVKCSGEFKDKPVLGLTFLWGFEQKDANSWKNGSVLDPHDGQIYRGSMTLVEDGKKLKLRGYWGIFWRTQTWIRVENGER